MMLIRLFYFLVLFKKDFSNISFTKYFYKIDPQLGAITIGAKVTSTTIIGAKLDAVVIGAKLLEQVLLF